MVRTVQLLLCALGVGGCATTATTPRGSVASSVGRDLRVCLTEPLAVGANQSFAVARTVMKPLHAKSVVLRPHTHIVGSGTFVRAIDDRCSVVRLTSDLEIRRGDELRLASAAP